MTNLLPEFLPGFPEIFLCLWAMGLLLGGVFQKKKDSGLFYHLTLLGIVIAILMVLMVEDQSVFAFNEMVLITPLTQALKVIVLGTVGVVLYMTFKYLPQAQMDKFEYPVLMIFATVGMMLMISAHDLMSAFLGLEMVNLCLYVMVSFARDRSQATEAGVKLFVLGALSSAFYLFGASYLYGFTGTTEFKDMAIVLDQTASLPLPIILAFFMILIALAFKVALVPFHMWVPDIYEGSPTPVTLFLASAPKVAGFALLMNFLRLVFGSHAHLWGPILSTLSFVTFGVGSIAALFQKNLKRLLAYSAISHMGFVLLGFLSLDQKGYENIFNYLTIYIVMTLGAFALVLMIRKRGQALESIDDLKGLSKEAPLVALCCAILFFSLAGVPPFAGFFAKLGVIQNALSDHYYLPVVGAVMASVISAAYYLRIIKVMYFEEVGSDSPQGILEDAIPWQTKAILVGAAALVTLYVFKPDLFMMPMGTFTE